MHTTERWSRDIIDRIKTRLRSKIKKDKDGCWIYNAKTYRPETPRISIRPVLNSQLGIDYVSAFLFKQYDLNSDNQVIRKCNKLKCCNPNCVEIVDNANTHK